jgi:hypothetical protein
LIEAETYWHATSCIKMPFHPSDPSIENSSISSFSFPNFVPYYYLLFKILKSKSKIQKYL